ncbi:hypothetical protein [Plantactinospora sp. GCM10030261]
MPRRVAAATGLTEDELVALRHTLTRITAAVHRQRAAVQPQQKEN